MAKTKEDKNSFEYSFNKLQDIMAALESDAEEASLDDLIKHYQEGLQYIKICRDKLNDAELKIEKINSENNSKN